MADNEVNVLRKITTKGLGFSQGIIVEMLQKIKPGEKVYLYTLAGVANRVDRGESNYGPFIKFRGDFAAKLPGQKKAIRSPACFVPPPFDGMLESAIMKATAQGKDSEGVEFAVNIWAMKAKDGERSATGYSYEVEPIVKLRESDAVSKLLETAEAASDAASKRK